jgi:uncharacterized membrane protein (TIGR02234 family)
VAAVACAAGAGLVLLAAGRTWATVRAQGAITPVTQPLAGRDLAGGISALGWAGLAALAALAATRGRARAAVGVLLTVLGGAAGYLAVRAMDTGRAAGTARTQSSLLDLGTGLTVQMSAWWAVALAGGILLAAGGILTTLRGSRWPGMSARYDRSGPTKPADPATSEDPARLWKSLDRGEDPTVQHGESTPPADPGTR